MKKTLLTIATMVAGILSMNAQCTITPGCTPDPTLGFCSTPSASTSLNAATIGTAYSSNIQISLGTNASGFTVTSATILAVSGMPAGISAVLNPTSGAILGGQSGCIGFTGTSTAAAGVYTVNASFKLTLNGVLTQTGSANWYLPLNANTTGINAIANTSNGILLLAPNPAKAELTVTSDLHLSKATIIDALGKIVLEQELNYANQATINISNLERGVYFLQANDGAKLMTKKFIKD